MYPTATHLPTLCKALTVFGRPALTVELGPGDYSTLLLRNSSDKFISLEMNSKEWGDRFGAEFDERPSAWMRFVALKPDLLFVDHGTCHVNMKSRGSAVQMALDIGVKQVVAHDTEELRDDWYGYGQIIVPDGYSMEIDQSNTPWTTRWWRE